MTARNEKGLLGGRLLLILAIIGILAAWAAYNGYIKWKGPKASEAAREVVEDAAHSAKQLVK